MPSRLRQLSPLVALVVALAGCGGSSHGTPTPSAETCADVSLAAEGATQGLLVTASVKNTGDKPCRLDGPLELSIRHPHGSVAESIHGNPATASLPGDLDPGARVERSWSWRNWCGADSTLELLARAAGAHAREDASPPVCVDRNAGSSLAREG